MALRGLIKADVSGVWVGIRGRPIGEGKRTTPALETPPVVQLWPSCATGSLGRRGLDQPRARVQPPTTAPAQATRIRSRDLSSRKVTANFLASFARPFSLSDPPPCGAGNSEGRSAGRDGECGGLQRTLETEAY